MRCVDKVALAPLVCAADLGACQRARPDGLAGALLNGNTAVAKTMLRNFKSVNAPIAAYVSRRARTGRLRKRSFFGFVFLPKGPALAGARAPSACDELLSCIDYRLPHKLPAD